MTGLSDRIVFSVGADPYTVADIVLAARAWGDWGQLEDEARQGLACTRHARATGAIPARKDVEAAAADFRIARHLRAAADMKAWLAEWGLSAEAWMDCVRRALMRAAWSADLAGLVARYPATQEEVDRDVLAEGLCSGRLARLAEKLAARAAAHARMESEAPTPLGLPPDVTQERAAVLARVEASFRAFTARLLTDRAVAQQVGARHTEWTWILGCAVSFPDEAAGREAALCVREDGEDLHDVARRAGATVESVGCFLEDVEPALRGLLLSTREGELLGPLRGGGGTLLFRVLAKTLPSPTDPGVRRRAEQEILGAALERETAARVRWHVRW